MDTFFSLLPNLPWTATEIAYNVAAGLGAILLVYGIFLEAERKQDAVFFFGGALLCAYAIWIGNKIFTIAMSGFAFGCLVEWIEIMLGRHIHSEELVEKYKHPKD